MEIKYGKPLNKIKNKYICTVRRAIFLLLKKIKPNFERRKDKLDLNSEFKYNIQYTESSNSKFSSVASFPLKAVVYVKGKKITILASSPFAIFISSQLPLVIEGSVKDGTLTLNQGHIKSPKITKLSNRTIRIRYSKSFIDYSLTLKFIDDGHSDQLDLIFKDLVN